MLDFLPEDDFWRDAKQDKSEAPELTPALEARARSGAPMRFFA